MLFRSSGSSTFRLTVTNVNDAPVLVPAAPVLAGITEDDTGNAGQTVASLLGSTVSDVDAGAVQGIALYGVTGGYGKWQYSTSGGTAWTDVGTVSASAALLLRAMDWVRWLPDGTNGTAATLGYYGWDQTSGTVGTTVSVASRGGTTAFSSSADTASLTVVSMPDAPRVANAIANASTPEDLAFSFSFPANSFAEVDFGDSISGYSASLASGASLPAWLSFDAATRTFIGTPQNTNVGAYYIKIGRAHV